MAEDVRAIDICRRAHRSGTQAPPSPCDTASSEGSGSFRAFAGSSPITRSSPPSEARQKSGPFPPPALPGFSGTMTLSDSRRAAAISAASRPRPSPRRVSPDYPHHLSGVPCPLPRRIERVHLSIASPFTRPSPLCRRVGIRTFTFEACSGFTRVTARRIAQPPKAAFVTRLRPGQLPNQTARQLPDQSTTLWVEPSSTGDTRLRGALHNPVSKRAVFCVAKVTCRISSQLVNLIQTCVC